MIRKIIITSLFWAIFLNSAFAMTYYVSNSGSNDSSGTTEQAAWQTCGYMMTQISGGDTVLFMGGTYKEQNTAYESEIGSSTLSIHSSKNGTYGNPTVFKGAPGYDRPIFSGYGTTGFNASCSTYAVDFWPQTEHIVLDSLIVKFAYRGISFFRSDSIWVKNTVVCSTGGISPVYGPVSNNAGVVFMAAGSPCNYITIEGCSLFTNRENAAYGGSANSAAILTYNFNYSKITNNVIWDQPNTHGAIFLKGGGNNYNEISYNTIFDSDEAGIILYYNCKYNEIHHNIIYNGGANSWGIDIHGTHYAGQDNDYNYVYNNTMYNVNQGMGWGAGGSEIQQMDSVYFWNNICVGSVYGFAKSVNAVINDCYIDYNCYYVLGGSSDIYYWDQTRYTLAEVLTSLYVDSNSVNVDPVFADPANNDFRLTAGSPSSVVSGGRGGAYLSYMGAHDPNVATYIISGTITNGIGGGALSGVTLSGLPGNPQTDINGDYSATVSSGWSGTATPVLADYTISPLSRTYNGVNSDISNEDYTAWPDILPPIISNVEATSITDRSATITWNTDELSTTQLEYGLTPGYGLVTTLDTTLTLTHSVDLDSLIADTLYHFQARSIDASGNEGVSGDFTFLTLTLDTTPPDIDGDSVSVGNITSHSAIIFWVTNEQATSQVDYGFTQTYGDSVYLDTLVLNHIVSLSSLQSDTLYHFRVRSSDASGNEAVSGDFTFQTDTLSVSDWDIISIDVSNAVSGTYPGYSTVAINDSVVNPQGGTSSTWASDESPTLAHWVELDFNDTVLVAGMVVYWAWNDYSLSWMCSQQYQIQYWDEGGTFLDITTVNNPVDDSVTATWFEPVTTSRIRYYQPANMGPQTYPTVVWLTELEIYGEAGIPTDAQEDFYVYPDSNEEVTSRYIEFAIEFESSPNIVFIEIDSSSDFSNPFQTVSNYISQDTAFWKPASEQDSTNIRNVLWNNGWYYWRASTDNITWKTFPFKLYIAAHAYPVPFRISDGHSRITFTNLSVNSKISIASVSGTIVFTQSGVGPGEWDWDVKNDRGRDLASGVYLYAVDSEGGTTQGKIVVIR